MQVEQSKRPTKAIRALNLSTAVDDREGEHCDAKGLLVNSTATGSIRLPEKFLNYSLRSNVINNL